LFAFFLRAERSAVEALVLGNIKFECNLPFDCTPPKAFVVPLRTENLSSRRVFYGK
jgi:hypothetical protein